MAAVFGWLRQCRDTVNKSFNPLQDNLLHKLSRVISGLLWTFVLGHFPIRNSSRFCWCHIDHEFHTIGIWSHTYSKSHSRFVTLFGEAGDPKEDEPCVAPLS